MGAVIGWTNLADSATLSTTTSGSMLRALTQLQIPWARGLCRGPANGTGSIPAELVIRADLGSAKNVSLIGLVGMNDAVASGTVSLSATAFGNTDAGSGTIGHDGRHGQTYGNSAWWMPSGNNVAFARYIEIYMQVFDLPVGLRHVDARRLLIFGDASGDGTNGAALFSAGVNFNWSDAPVDQSSQFVTPKGGVFVAEEGIYRRRTFGVSGMTVAEAASMRALLAKARRKSEAGIALRYDSDSETQSNACMYGRLVDWTPVVHTGGDTYACETITFDETPHPAL